MSEQHGPPRIPALIELREEFVELEAVRAPGRSRQISRRVAVLTGAAAIALILFLGFTSSGQSVAKAIGSFVGIGDEPSSGLLPGESNIVIGVGDTARSYPFEIVARTNHPQRPPAPVETCIYVEFPTLQGQHSVVGKCLTDSTTPEFIQSSKLGYPSVYEAPRAFAPDAGWLVQGFVSNDVTRVVVRFKGGRGVTGAEDAPIFDLDDQLGSAIGVDDRVRFLFASLPPSANGVAYLTAIGEAGLPVRCMRVVSGKRPRTIPLTGSTPPGTPPGACAV